MFGSRVSELCHRVSLTAQSNLWRNILASVFTNQSTRRSGNPKSYHTNDLFKSLGFSGWCSLHWIVLWALVLMQYVAWGNLPYFGRTFLRLSFVDVVKHTYSRIWTVTEILAREKCVLLRFHVLYLSNPYTTSRSLRSTDKPSRTETKVLCKVLRTPRMILMKF
jgi:hypothetical protein